MAIHPSALRLLGGTPPAPPQRPASTWDDYIKPAVMAPLHVLGAGYRGIGTLASAAENYARTGDVLSGFSLTPEARETDLGADVAGAFGFGTRMTGVRSPAEIAAGGVREAFGGLGAQDVDPEWEAAFRRAAPVQTGVEAAGNLAAEFATQAVLDPVMHGLGGLGARAAGASTSSVLPPAIAKALPTVAAATESRIPGLVQRMSPEAAGRAAKALGAAFVPGMAISAAERLSEAPGAIREQVSEHGLSGLVSAPVVETAGQGVVDAAFAGMGLAHALRRSEGPKPPTGEEQPEMAEAQGMGEARATPAVPATPKAPYEPPAIRRREDLLALSPEEEAQLAALNDVIEPTREMEAAVEGKAVEPAPAVATTSPSLEARFKNLTTADLTLDDFVDIPPDLRVRPTYEDILAQVRGEVAGSERIPLPQADELGVSLPAGATEALRVPLHQVAAADLRGREGKFALGHRGASPQQAAARAIYAEAEDIANEINRRLTSDPSQGMKIDRTNATPQAEITPEDVLAGRAGLQISGAKRLGGGLTATTPEQKQNLIAALAARAIRNRQDLDGITKQSIVDGLENGTLVEMLTGKREDTGFTRAAEAPRTMEEVAAREALGQVESAREGGLPEDVLGRPDLPTRQEDPLAGAAERMAAVKARRAAEAQQEEGGPSEDALMAAIAKAKTRPAPETAVVEQPRVERATPPPAPKEVVEPVPYTDKDGNPIEGDFFLSPEKAKKATEMGLTQETAELLSEDFDTFAAQLETMDARLRPHLLGLYRKFHATNLAPRAGEGVHAVLKGAETAAASPILVDRDTPIEKRYTTVAAPRREAPQAYTQKSSLPSDFGVPKGPSLLEKMAARKKAEEAAALGEGEQASVGATPESTPPVSALLSQFKDTRRNVITKHEQLPDGGIHVTMKDGQEIEFHPSGEIYTADKDIANREGKIRGSYRAVGAKSYIKLVEGEADFTTVLHEEFHPAFMRQFNVAERAEFYRNFRDEIRRELKIADVRKMDARQAKAAEEIVAEGVAKWANEYLKKVRETGSTKHTPGWFKRLWDYITRVVRAFKSPEFETLARDFAEGRIYDRSGTERFARRVGERLRGEGAGEAPSGEQFSAATAGARSPEEIAAARKAWLEKGTESPWFKRWFGASKAVDTDGKPLVVYHGSSARFTAFDSAKHGSATDSGYLGEGHYFADSQDIAHAYAGAAGADSQRLGIQSPGSHYIPVGSKSAIYPAYLALKRPLELNALHGPNPANAAASYGGRTGHIRKVLGLPEGAPAAEVTTALRAGEYDGVIYTYQDGVREFMVLDSAQIKSATGNRGTFDTESGDVRYQRTAKPDPADALKTAQDELNKAREAARGLRGEPEKGEQFSQRARPQEETTTDRTFYRGTTSGDPRRIEEPFTEAKGKTFMSRREASARMYGSDIEKIVAKPDAKILREESPEFWKLIGRRRPPNGYVGSATRPGETFVDLVNSAIRKATAAGYDIVSFKSDSDIGTIVLNEHAVVRERPGTYPMQGEQFQVTAKADPVAALKTAQDELEAARAAARGLRGDPQKAAAARVRAAGKAFRTAQEAVVQAQGRLDEGRPPVDIAARAPGAHAPVPGAEGPTSLTQVAQKKREVQAWRAELGLAPHKWKSLIPESQRSLIPKVEEILDTETPQQIFSNRTPSAAREMAKAAFTAGRREDLRILREKKAEALAQGKSTAGFNAEAVAASYDLVISEVTRMAEMGGRKAADYRTELARALSAGNAIMSAGRSLPDTFLRDLFKKIPNISRDTAENLANLVRDGKYEQLPEALHKAVAPTLFDKALEAWKSGLVSAPGTLVVANPGGNILEGVARIAEAPFGVLADAIAAKATGGERTRSFGEIPAETRAIRSAAPEAFKTFRKDLTDIFSGKYGDLANMTEAQKTRGLHEVLQYPPAIGAGYEWARKLVPGGHVGNAVRIPLNILGATDTFFRKLGLAAELGKLSYREAAKEVKGTPALVQRRAQEIMELAQQPGSKYETLLTRAHEMAAERVFQKEAPALRGIKSARANIRPLGVPIGHLFVPFLDTPFNIFKLMMERSPVGSIGAIKAWTKLRIMKQKGDVPVAEMERMRDEAIDLTARAALGSAMFFLFWGAAKSGMMTGAGPTDPKSKKALMETGWQPYSFKIGDTFIPFNRFEPVSSILGFAADINEIENAGAKEGKVKKAAAAFMTNALSKTYLQGLSDAAGLIVDPERYGPEYAASLAGSAVPNIVAKAAQAVDPVVRETRPPEGGVTGRIAATVQSRIPGASTLLPPQLEFTGETRERPNADSIAGAVSRFALPVQVTQRKAGAELQEEFARLGYPPPVPDRKLRVSGKDVVLAPSEQAKLGLEYQKASERARRLMQSPAYKNAPDDGEGRTKRKMLDRLYDEANSRFKARYAGVLRARVRGGTQAGATA